jgi:hypothetical protein
MSQVASEAAKFYFLMKIIFQLFLLNAALALLPQNVRAGFFDDLKSAVTSTNGAGGTSGALSSLPEAQVADGLKEALGKGVTIAVGALGHSDGLLTNLEVKIPIPDKLQSVEKALRMAGQSQMADEFVASMNHAAEQAVPVAADVFGDAIKQMSIDDARSILAGPNDAATQYFRRATQTNLYSLFYPIVQKCTDQVGMTQKYKEMIGKFSSLNSFGSFFGSSSTTTLQAADLDAYVTKKALDGLFKMVADEEKDIRANPLARTTGLLKTVFGSGQ